MYKNIFYIYPPLYFWLLAGWDKIFGVTLPSLQSLTYLIIGFTDLLLFFAAKRKLWPVIIYIPLQIFFEGNGLWPDQLLAPLFLLCYLAHISKKYFWLGLFFGLAILTKQTAAYFIFVLGIINFRQWSKIVLGLLIPLGVTLISLISQNSLSAFYQQTILYIFSYHVGNVLQQLWPTPSQILVLAVIFLPPLFLGAFRKKYLLVFLTISASLGMFTRFSYFHLQPALPFLALLIPLISPISLITPIILGLFLRTFFLNFHATPKFLDPQTLAGAKIINQFLPPGSQTLILTSSDHYYYLTKTIPVGNFFTTSTPWNLAYPGVEDRIVKDLEAEQPKFVIIRDQNNKITNYIGSKFVKFLELPDGAGIFQNNPVGLGQEL